MTSPTPRERIEAVKNELDRAESWLLDGDADNPKLPMWNLIRSVRLLRLALRDFMAEREQAGSGGDLPASSHAMTGNAAAVPPSPLVITNCHAKGIPEEWIVQPTAPAPHTAAGEERCTCGHMKAEHVGNYVGDYCRVRRSDKADGFCPCTQYSPAPAPDVGRERNAKCGDFRESEGLGQHCCLPWDHAGAHRYRPIAKSEATILEELETLRDVAAALRQRVGELERERDELVSYENEKNGEIVALNAELRALREGGVEGRVVAQYTGRYDGVAPEEWGHQCVTIHAIANWPIGTPVRVTVRTKEGTP